MISICGHCLSPCTEKQLYCKNCKTPELRKEMCLENLKNNPKHECRPFIYECKPCDLTNEKNSIQIQK